VLWTRLCELAKQIEELIRYLKKTGLLAIVTSKTSIQTKPSQANTQSFHSSVFGGILWLSIKEGAVYPGVWFPLTWSIVAKPWEWFATCCWRKSLLLTHHCFEIAFWIKQVGWDPWFSQVQGSQCTGAAFCHLLSRVICYYGIQLDFGILLEHYLQRDRRYLRLYPIK
jgi:hypothetical protein